MPVVNDVAKCEAFDCQSWCLIVSVRRDLDVNASDEDDQHQRRRLSQEEIEEMPADAEKDDVGALRLSLPRPACR